MKPGNFFFVGFGDLAQRCVRKIRAGQCFGLARSPRPALPGVQLWQGSAADPGVGRFFADRRFDVVFISLTPNGFSDQGYLEGYVQPIQNLLPVLREHKPALTVFVSSTGVYDQSEGEWVDEYSVTEPSGFSGRRLLQAEQLLSESGLPHMILRLAGIYGPGRDHLQRSVRAGQGGSTSWTNRIHADDAAAAMLWLAQGRLAGTIDGERWLVCDDCPAMGTEVRHWLAAQMGIDPATLQPSDTARGGNKRCSNARLRETGFSLQYPDYRSGYRALLGVD